jgi:hypothetical protein
VLLHELDHHMPRERARETDHRRRGLSSVARRGRLKRAPDEPRPDAEPVDVARHGSIDALHHIGVLHDRTQGCPKLSSIPGTASPVWRPLVKAELQG